MTDYRLIQQRFVLGTYAHRGLTITHGKGMYLYDNMSNEYLDLMSQYGVHILGYSNPRVAEAITTQSSRLLALHGSFANDARASASRALLKRCGQEYYQVYWSNSGAEAVEAALKFAVLATGKKQFIRMRKGYHGKTLGALSATDGAKYRTPFEPLIWEFTPVPFGDLGALKTAITSDTAGVLLEPVQGEGGVIPGSQEYLKGVRSLCTASGALFIADEIQCGMGRTGSFLNLFQAGVAADILCLGKGLAGGLPVGATIVNKSVADRIPKLIHSSTFGGNPLVCAAVEATLQELTAELIAHVSEMGDYFLSQLRGLRHSAITEIRGAGLMIGIDVAPDRNMVLKELQKKGILAIPAGEHTVRFLPPYIINQAQIDHVCQAFAETLTQLSHEKLPLPDSDRR